MGFFDGIFDNLDGNSKDNDLIVLEVQIGEGKGAYYDYTLIRGHDNALRVARMLEWRNGFGSGMLRNPKEFSDRDLSRMDPWGFYKLKPKTA